MSAATAKTGSIWRNSFPTDHPRAQVARRFGDGSVYQGKTAARCIADAAEEWAGMIRKECKPREDCKHCQARKDHKACRDCRGPWLHDGAIKTLRRLLQHCVDYKTGRIEATLERIAEVALCSKITVIRHLFALRRAGWIDWVRRITREGEGGRWVPTANAYFFEISRLPSKARRHLVQKLKRAGVKLFGDADREGSGPVPSFRERMVQAIGRMHKAIRPKRTRQLEADAQFVRDEMALMGDLPIERWAEIRHPGDSEAQRAYALRLGIDPGD